MIRSTIEPFPVYPRRRRPARMSWAALAGQLIALSVALNMLTLIVVAHLSWTLFRLVQR
jgi:hypothetical protein